jgi:ArsR family transcriptional regulator
MEGLALVQKDRYAQAGEGSVPAGQGGPVDGQTAQLLAGIFKGLSDPNRVRIIAMLLDGETCVSDLAAALGMSQSAVSHQLSDMRDMRLVRYRREGRHVFYTLDDEHVRDLLQMGLAHAGHR